MDFRTTAAHTFRRKITFKQYEVILMKVLTKIISADKNNEFT